VKARFSSIPTIATCFEPISAYAIRFPGAYRSCVWSEFLGVRRFILSSTPCGRMIAHIDPPSPLAVFAQLEWPSEDSMKAHRARTCAQMNLMHEMLNRL
jgi:hypothetical protein